MKKMIGLILSAAMFSQSFAFAQSNRVAEAMALTAEQRADEIALLRAEIHILNMWAADLEQQIDDAVAANGRAQASIVIKKSGLLLLGTGLVTLYAASRSLRVAAKSGTHDTIIVKVGTEAVVRASNYLILAGGASSAGGVALEPADIKKLRHNLKLTKGYLVALEAQLQELK